MAHACGASPLVGVELRRVASTGSVSPMSQAGAERMVAGAICATPAAPVIVAWPTSSEVYHFGSRTPERRHRRPRRVAAHQWVVLVDEHR